MKCGLCKASLNYSLVIKDWQICRVQKSLLEQRSRQEEAQ